MKRRLIALVAVLTMLSIPIGYALVGQNQPSISDSTMPDAQAGQIPANIAQANNQLAVDFYRQISDNDENQFFSPLSMHVAFSMLYEGAGGNSAAQLQDAFGFEPDDEVRAADVTQMISSINRDDPHATVELANSLWLDHRLYTKPSYMDTIRRVYAAHIETLALSEAADAINGWASEKTHEKIPSVVSPNDLTQAVAVLANAVYFKGTWVTQFDPEDTKPGTFWKNSQNSTETDFMSLPGSTFNFTQADGIKILKMPYDGDRLSMLLLLPNDRDGISDLEGMLSAEKLQEWQENLRPVDVIVKIPKFTLEITYDLIDPLMALGVTDVFGDDADLSGIGPGDLSVSKALQKTFVDVNEEGTEAAAVTVIVLSDSESPPLPTFIADHPFLFVIQDDESETILFMGRFSGPP